MSKRLLWAMTIAVVVLFSVSFSAGWLIYHKPAFRGRVIDAETREPIEGAVVVVSYSKYFYGIVQSFTTIIEVRETLTDSRGEFTIPSFYKLIQPLSWEERARFIIYKPGYGSFPRYQVSPALGKGVGPEDFFGGELGKEGEIVWKGIGTKTKVTFGVVELPRLKTKEEREESFHVADRIPPEFENNVPAWKKLLLQENSFLGEGR